MRLLFDQNISHRLIKQISTVLPDSKQVRDLNIENHSDKAIWEFAKNNEYSIVTFDSDFYDFSLVWGHPPKIIWLRTYNQTTRHIEEMLRKHLDTIKEFVSNQELACLEIISVE